METTHPTDEQAETGLPAAEAPEAEIGVTVLSPALGAEITGIDLRHEVDDGSVALMRAAWRDHMVLVLRGQEIGSADQMRFCSYFGELGKRARPAAERPEANDPDAPEHVMFVSNEKIDGEYAYSLPEGEHQFHIDQIYIERPSSAGCLYGMAVPAEGGETLFANMCAAYEALPGDVKQTLEGRDALNVFEFEVTRRDQVLALPEGTPRFAHPAVRFHPETGQKSLFVSRMTTLAIEGLPPDESAELLEFLFDHFERPEFVYAHDWCVGDVVLWDNRRLAHGRRDFDPNQRRHLRRFTVQGERPV